MRRRRTRVLGVLVAVAMAALTFQFGGGPIPEAGAANISFTCSGATNDVAGQIGGRNQSSAGLLSQLGTVLPPPLRIPLNVTAQAPAQVKKGSPPFNVRIGVGINLDPALANTMRTLLGKTSVGVQNARLTVAATNGGGTLVGNLPNSTINLTGGNVTQFFNGTVNPANNGRINYVPTQVNLDIVVNASVAGAATVGTLRLTCRGSGDSVGSTLVTIPGAPLPADIRVKGHWGINLWNILGTPGWVRPDNNNPIIPSSLRITKPMPRSFGLVAVKDGWLGMLTGPMGGTRTVGMNVCAGSLTIPEEPGQNEKFNVGFTGRQIGNFNNAHITGFQLKVGDQTTAAISTSRTRNPLTGAISSTPLSDVLDANALLINNNVSLVSFASPTPDRIKQRLEALSNVGAGNVQVTLADPLAPDAPASYDIEFVGALAEVDMPDIEISRTWGHLPTALQDQVGEAAAGLAGGGGEAPETPDTPEQLFQKFLTGQITGDQFGTKLGEYLGAALLGGIDVAAALETVNSYFAERPVVERTQPAVQTVPARATGPLCTPFEFRAQNDAVPLNLVLFFTFLANRAAGRA